jgi:hypothetical protein
LRIGSGAGFAIKSGAGCAREIRAGAIKSIKNKAKNGFELQIGVV